MYIKINFALDFLSFSFPFFPKLKLNFAFTYLEVMDMEGSGVSEKEGKERDRVYIFDTTLRDGEQSPGASMSMEEKLQVARALKELNVDIIEAGFPISSEDQFLGVKKIAEEIEGPVIAGLARCNEEDISACIKALEPAKKKRIHVFISTSPIHMEKKLKKKPDEVLKLAIESVKYAKSFVEDVEFSAEDATRSDWKFLAEIFSAVIEAGATTINVPDTVGYTMPMEFHQLIEYLKKNVPNIDKAIISVHCHNDLGLAVANSLFGVLAGARQVECTINGIGERAGNAAMEEIVMAIKVRKDIYPVYTDINTKKLYPTSQLVSRITGMCIQPNKAIVGANAFAHESGIHQHGVISDRLTYEIMDPEDVGREEGSKLVLGKHSGRHGLKERLEKLGIKLTEDEFEKVYIRFKKLADKKKEVYDDDLVAIVEDEVKKETGYVNLDYMLSLSGTNVVPTATIRLKQQDGSLSEEASTGDGQVDAAFNAIDKILGKKPKLREYNLRAITGGRDALGEVSLTIEHNGKIYYGWGTSTDIIEASVKAYINAYNKILRD